MSYRTRVNDVQLFGNNEYYDLWLDFIKSQGITIGEAQQYDGEIKDFTAAVQTCEQIVLQVEQERQTQRAEHLARMSPNTEGLQEWMDKHIPTLFDLSDIKQTLAENETLTGNFATLQTSLFDCLYEKLNNGYLFLPLTLYEICKNDVEIKYMQYDKHPGRQRSFEILPSHHIHVHAG